MPGKPTPKSVETRELILRHALQAFALKGFDGSSTRDIASSAGVNLGLIPYHFGSKEKLWKAAVDLAFAEMHEDFQTILSDPAVIDDRERAARLIRMHVHFVAKHPEFVRLMNEEGKRRGPRMRWLADRHVKPLYESIAVFVARGSQSGALPFTFAPLHFFYVLAGAAGMIFHQAEECQRISGVDPFDPAVVAEHARVVEQLLLGVPDTARSQARSESK